MPQIRIEGKNVLIHIIVDRKGVFPGNEVSGRVIIDISEEIRSSTFLVVNLIGQEETIARYTISTENGNGHMRTLRKSHNERNVLISEIVPLVTSFSRGTHEYPFAFIVPLNAPPSMKAILPGDEGGECSVSYFVQAQVQESGSLQLVVDEGSGSFIVKAMSATKDLALRPLYVLKPEQVIYYLDCCCFQLMSQGKMSLGALCSKSVLYSNDPIEIAYAIQNDSKAEIRDITIMIQQTVTWVANGMERVLITKLYEVRINPSEYVGSLNGSASIEGLLHEKRNVLTGILDSTNVGTMKSKLIEAKHSIHLIVTTPFGMTNPEATTPIMILPPSARQHQEINQMQPSTITTQPSIQYNSVPATSSLELFSYPHRIYPEEILPK